MNNLADKNYQNIAHQKANITKQAILDLDAVKAERCKRSLFYFIKTFWEVVSSETPVWNWHIEYLCQELQKIARQVANKESKEYDLIVNIPPGTTKSICVSIMFPVWCWINWYWFRFIVGSYSGSLSLEHAEYSRDVVKSEKFKKLFPELDLKRDKDTKSNFKIVKTEEDGTVNLGGNRYSTSTGGTVTGFHAHIQIIDDPLNPQQAASEVELETANKFVDQTMSTRKVDKRISVRILVMQRLHENDPSGHLLEKKKEKIKHICLPGESKNYKDQIKPKELEEKYIDDLLDPVRMPWSVMREMENDLGQYGYAGQVGQRPTPPTGGMFKVDHFQKINSIKEDDIIATVRYWDKAGTDAKKIKKGRKAAYTAGIKMSRLVNGSFVIEDVKRGQWASEEREQIILETAKVDGNTILGFLEQEPGSGGKESAESSIKSLAGFVYEADRPTGDKVYRADPYSVQVNYGNVLLINADWNYEFIEEHRFFPFSTYKDQVDAAAGAFAKLIDYGDDYGI